MSCSAAQQRDTLTTEILSVAAEMLGGAVGQLVPALSRFHRYFCRLADFVG